MVMAQPGELPAPWAEWPELELSSPKHEVVTADGTLPCDWSNTTLLRFEDPSQNHIQFADGETTRYFNVLDEDWDTLLELDFPWDYTPNMDKFDAGDFIRVQYGPTMYDFHPNETRMRLFPDKKYNHVEHRLSPEDLRGLQVHPAVWRMMFKGDFPMRYLPYVDKSSKDWADSVGIK